MNCPVMGGVAREEQALAPFGAHQLLGICGIGVLIEIEDRDVRAFARKVHRDCTTDAAVTAADQRDLVPELAAATIVVADRERLGDHFILAARLMLLFLGGLQRPGSVGRDRHRHTPPD